MKPFKLLMAGSLQVSCLASFSKVYDHAHSAAASLDQKLTLGCYLLYKKMAEETKKFVGILQYCLKNKAELQVGVYSI
jgi:hypothetical protein